MNAVITKTLTTRSAVIGFALSAAVSFAATCPFDTGGSDAINDGVVLTRYALGITGAPMTASTRYASLDPLQVKANIECVGCALDMNGDNQIDAVDATIIARHLAGFSGAAVTNGLALGAGSRSSPTAVTSFLANGCAVGGAINAFVQGGNAFGAPGVMGTNDGQPLTVKSGSTDLKLVNQRGDGFRVSYSANSPNTINGNNSNTVTAGAFGATIGGGGRDGVFNNNQVTATYGTVSGGVANVADAQAVVSGGAGNSATALASVIVGGAGNSASGSYSTVAGGSGNRASGVSSFAAGYQAYADKEGAFVWADNSTNTPFKASMTAFGVNTFSVRATGGVLFATGVNATTGAPETYCLMRIGISGWFCTSDRNVKERIEPIKPSRVLAGVLAMPVSTWSIIGSKFRQMGPMAQDFYRAFGLGDTNKAINSIDASGVAFAAIQGLNARLTAQMKSKDAENAKLKARLAAIEKRLGI